jgi:hypothetical protein
MEAPPCPPSNRDKHLCLRISKNSPIAGATMRRRVQPTPAAPMPPTGSIFAPGAEISPLIHCCQPADRRAVHHCQASGSGRDKKSVSTIERRLSSLTWTIPNATNRSTRKIGTSPLCPPAFATRAPPPPEGSGPPWGSYRHAGDARSRHAMRPAPLRHATDRLRRRLRPARKSSVPALHAIRPMTAASGSSFFRTGVLVKLRGKPAGVKSRSAAIPPTPPALWLPCRLGSSWPGSDMVHYSGAW